MRFAPSRFWQVNGAPTPVRARTTVYNLVGVVVHDGRTVESGHYYSVVLNQADGAWYCVNDLTVTPFDPAKISDFFGGTASCTAYILFYQQSFAAS
eukprot:SAG11_NODE_28226_length_324_cov_0.693333_1_plen_95_part_10